MDIVSLIGHLSFIAVAASFMIRDILWLRAVSILGSILAILFNYFVTGGPIWLVIGWSFVFILLNLYNILLLLRERRGVSFSAQEKEMYENTSGNWKKLEWKGITAFLLITFTLTYALEAAIILNGISPLVKGLGQYTVAVAMWIPALATILTIKFITREKFGSVNIRLGDWKPYVSVALIIPACFVLIYGLSWLFGWGQPDWELQYFRNLFVTTGIEAPPIPSPFFIWPVLFFASLIVAPFFNSLLAFGEELGWRGYLLPKLMPLGKRWAH